MNFKTKQCQCGCNTPFTPNSARQSYIAGHRAQGAPAPSSKPKPERQTPSLDYRLALKSARNELIALDKEIEALDDRMENFRGAIAQLQAAKDKACSKHETATAIVAVLELALAEEEADARTA